MSDDGTDIVERLQRELAEPLTRHQYELLHDARDEIEQLRADVKVLNRELDLLEKRNRDG